MHATLQVAAVLYIEALEMQLVSMYVCMCVCVCAGPVYMGGGGGVTVVTLSVCMGEGGGGGCVTVVILSVHIWGGDTDWVLLNIQINFTMGEVMCFRSRYK